MKLRPSTIFTFCRTANAIGETPRTVTLTSVPSPRFGRAATTFISGDAIGRPCASRLTRESTMMMLALSREKPELSSDPDPRCVTIAFSMVPVDFSALRKPLAIAVSAISTATTSEIPPSANSVTFQRTSTLRTLYERGSAIRPASTSS